MSATRPIVIDARFVTQGLTGVQRYALEVTKRFPEALLLSPQAPRSEYAELAGRITAGPGFFKGHLWEQLVLPLQVPRGALLWSPGNIGPLVTASQVVTIHDTAQLEHPEWYSPAFVQWYRFILPRLAHTVRRIVTVSEYSKRQVVSLMGVPDDRVVSIPLGVAPHFRTQAPSEVERVRERYGLPEGYLLAVSALSPRKNMRGLFAAFRKARAQLGDVTLAVVGQVATRTGAVERYDQLDDSIRFLGRVPDQDLPAIYSGALAFLYPSFYEGFGLPPLEAMACGAPVLTSNTTALPETVGDAALLVDPHDHDSVTQGVVRIVTDGALRERLRVLGLARAAEFTWERTARETWSLLQNT